MPWFAGYFIETPYVEIEPPAGAVDFTDELVPGLVWSDHVARGLSHLLQQFKEKPIIEQFLKTWLGQVQDVENTIWALKLFRGVLTATGRTLDGIGEIIGEPDRGGATDADYRVRILVRIVVNTSNGKREDLLSILVLLDVLPVAVYNHFPASVAYHPEGPITGISAEQLFRILNSAIGGGVRLTLVHTYEAAEDTFTQDSYTDPFTTSGQWSGSYGETLGGILASVTAEG